MRRQLWLACVASFLLAGIVAGSGGASADQSRTDTGRFTFHDHFVISPGDPASCPFAVTADQVGKGSFQVLRDASGTPIRVTIHNVWVGTLSANEKTDIEHAAQKETFDLVDGSSSDVGSIHDQVFGGGVVIHDVGILRFDGDGNLTFEAGPHQGFDGDPSAIARLCNSLT